MNRGRNFPLAFIVAAYHGAIEELVWVNEAGKRPGQFLAVVEGSDQGNLTLDLVDQDDLWKLLLDRTEMKLSSSGAAGSCPPRRDTSKAYPYGSKRLVECQI